MNWKERERAFYLGAPLAIVPALGFLPAVMFLVVVPKVVSRATNRSRSFADIGIGQQFRIVEAGD